VLCFVGKNAYVGQEHRRIEESTIIVTAVDGHEFDLSFQPIEFFDTKEQSRQWSFI
jgi:hypothetical protein